MRPAVAVFVACVANVLGGLGSPGGEVHADNVVPGTAGKVPADAVAGPHEATGDLAAQFWRNRPELVASNMDLPSYCGGAYVEREFEYPLTIDSSTYVIVARAGRLHGTLDGTIDLIGDVTLQQGNRHLATDVVAVDHPRNTAAMPNTATLVEPGIAMRGVDGMIDFADGRARMNDAEFVLFDAHMRGTSAVLEKRAATLRLTRTSLTSCRPSRDTWLFSARQVDIDDGDVFATARGAALQVLGVPLFYTPYLRFPITDERVSGFLFPAFGYGDDDGVDLALPYYLNLAPNYDATITPRVMTRRGVGAELEFRVKNGWSDSQIGGAFLADDDQYDGTLSREDFIAEGGVPADFVPADRWLFGFEHDGRFGPWSTLVDYVSVSDIDYYSDLGSDLDITSQVSLERRGELQYAKGGLFARVWAQSFQILEDRPEPYRRLPEFNATYIREVGPLSMSLGGAWTRFDRQSHPQLSGLNLITGDRLHLEPRIQLPLRRPWGFLTVTGGGRYSAYNLEDDPAGDPSEPERSVGLASVDGGLIFDRDTHYFGEDAVQTLEPRVYYLYQEYVDQDDLPRFDSGRLTFRFTQLFRNNRFSGLDRIGDADQVSVGLTSRFISSDTGSQRARFDIGTIIHMRDRRVTLNGDLTDDEFTKTSEIVGAAQFRLGDHFKGTANVLWDASENEIDEAGMSLGWSSERRRVLHVGYRRQVSRNIDQTDLGIYWPLNERVSFIGKWNHDWQFGQNVESFAGLEYASCCLQVRAVWRKFIVTPGNRIVEEALDDEGIVVQFVFRGLAGFGNKLDSLLSRGIRGYRPENRYDSYGYTY